MAEEITEVQSAPIITPIPPSIVKRVCQVQATIPSVEKTEFNKHGGYKFASTDNIYAVVTRKLGEVGLMIYPLELTPTQETITKVDVLDRDGTKTGEKTVTKLRFHFGYMLATEEASWFDPRSSRTIIVAHTGPQTFNAAESYCQKAYLRALLKIPTGDQDLDSMPQAETEEDQAGLNSIGRVKRKSSSSAKKDGVTVDRFNRLIKDIGEATEAVACGQIWASAASEIATLPRAWFEEASQTYYYKMKDFGVEVEIDDQRTLQAAE